MTSSEAAGGAAGLGQDVAGALRRAVRLAIRGEKPKTPAALVAEEFGRPAHRVELVHWSPGRSGVQNFGDHLSLIVVTKILSDACLFLSQAVGRPARLLSIGSILHMARDGDTVWGSGINGKTKPENFRFTQLDVRALRGPRTHEFLAARGIDAPEVYGDPALLIARLIPQWGEMEQVRPYAFVPNLFDLPLVRGWRNIVSPLDPWNICVDRILSSELILASSLHGLIVAEAYGIPARYVRLSEEETLFKYEDYYLGTGRAMPEIATSIEEGIEMGGAPPPKVDPVALLRAFPFDLWSDEALDLWSDGPLTA